MIDLREKDRLRIIELAEHTLPKGTQLWAFGSRVKGTNHDTSDLDLVLVSKTEQDYSLKQVTTFKEALQESNIPILIKVLSWWHIPVKFQTNISQHYEILHCVGEQKQSHDQLRAF